MILVRKHMNGGGLELLAIQATNVITANPQEGNHGFLWLKYWDGQSIRTTVIESTMEELVSSVYYAKHGK